MRKIKFLVIGLVLTVTIVAIFYGYKEYNRKNKPMQEEIAQFTLSAQQLTNEFATNEVEATKKYVGKVINVNGTVVATTMADSVQTVLLQGINDNSGVFCEFVTTQKNSMITIKKGNQLTVKGMCTGLLLDVVLTNCIINNQ